MHHNHSHHNRQHLIHTKPRYDNIVKQVTSKALYRKSQKCHGNAVSTNDDKVLIKDVNKSFW